MSLPEVGFCARRETTYNNQLRILVGLEPNCQQMRRLVENEIPLCYCCLLRVTSAFILMLSIQQRDHRDELLLRIRRYNFFQNDWLPRLCELGVGSYHRDHPYFLSVVRLVSKRSVKPILQF